APDTGHGLLMHVAIVDILHPARIDNDCLLGLVEARTDGVSLKIGVRTGVHKLMDCPDEPPLVSVHSARYAASVTDDRPMAAQIFRRPCKRVSEGVAVAVRQAGVERPIEPVRCEPCPRRRRQVLT